MKKNPLKYLYLSIASSLLVTGSPVLASTGTVSADLLNVRTAPSTDSDVVSMLTYGDTVTITYEPGNGWYEIYTNGSCYYVNSSFISTGSSSAASAYTENTASYDYDTTSYDTSWDTDSSSQTYSDTSYYEEYSTDSSTDTSTSNGTYLGTFALTAYCNCASCCGSAGNLTASGTVPTEGRTVAMGGVPFGTQLLINGTVYTVEDRGTSYGTVDIFFNSHSDACAFGLQYAEVYQLN